jgi:hypothetical protein
MARGPEIFRDAEQDDDAGDPGEVVPNFIKDSGNDNHAEFDPSKLAT